MENIHWAMSAVADLTTLSNAEQKALIIGIELLPGDIPTAQGVGLETTVCGFQVVFDIDNGVRVLAINRG